MDLNEDELEQDFIDTCEENQFFVDVYRKYSSPGGFISRSECIFARGLALDASAASVFLKYSTDIDGTVVELKKVTGYIGTVRHLTVCSHNLFSVKSVRGVLKKHVDLHEYTRAELVNFNRSVGIQLFYEGGWECWLALVPVRGAGAVEMSQTSIRDRSYNVFSALKGRLQKVLAGYAARGEVLRTLAKNDLNDLRKMFVLPDDSATTLSALQLALDGLEPDQFRPILFCFRFGEKMSGGQSLTNFDKSMIAKVTVHAAIDIAANESDIDLMWSMYGLQKVVGNRGTLCTCLSFKDCGNFQSNLDGRLIDVSADLRRICHSPEKLKFVQLYADLPHRQPKSRFHPVSGLIVGGMCFPKSTETAFEQDSESYLSALDSNWSLMRRSTCRLEVVCEVTAVSDVIMATDVIDVLELDKLLQKKPMLVPFPVECLCCIRELGLWMTWELKGLLQKFKNTGNVEATWRAFQLELASEKLLWGRPLCKSSNNYSVNLGPGRLLPSRSLTDDFGFLRISSWSSCLLDEDSIPSVLIWTRSDVIGKSIERAVGLHDVVDGSYPVIGRRVLMALLKDLYCIGKVDRHCSFGDFLAQLKAVKTKFRVAAAITATSLCEVLVGPRRLATHMVYGSLCRLLESNKVSLKMAVVAGLKELQLTFFPSLQTCDSSGHSVLSWSLERNFWAIIHSESISDLTVDSASVFSDLVRCDLERRVLIFPSKLKRISFALPWIGVCLWKLKQEELDRDDTIKTLTFISCIAFIMQGWFIDYERLSGLVSDLPVTQGKLRSLEIQSKLRLACVHVKDLTLFRLHPSIPHRLDVTEKGPSRESRVEQTLTETAPTEDRVYEESRSKIGDSDDEIAESNFWFRDTVCKPVEVLRKVWSRDELELFEEVRMLSGKSMGELYSEYRDRCLSKSMSFRTFGAFKGKYHRSAPGNVSTNPR